MENCISLESKSKINAIFLKGSRRVKGIEKDHTHTHLQRNILFFLLSLAHTHRHKLLNTGRRCMHGSLDFPHYTLHFSSFPFHVSSHMLLLLCMHAHSSVNLVLRYYTYKPQCIQIVVEMSRKKREMFGFTQRCGILFCVQMISIHILHII